MPAILGVMTDQLADLCTRAELDRIAADLATHRRLDTRFSYLGAGAAHWDAFVAWQATDPATNMLLRTRELLRDAHDDLLTLFPPAAAVHLADLGPGNAAPVVDLLARLGAAGRLKTYTAVDLSASMLALAERNLHTVLGAGTPMAFHRRDFATGDLTDLLDAPALVLLVGGTLLNFAAPRTVLRHLRTSLPRPGVLVTTMKIDTTANRTAFRFGATNTGGELPERYRYLLDLLGIEHCTPEFGYDEARGERFLRIRLTAPVTVELPGAAPVHLPAGDTVHLWRYRHHRTPDVLDLFHDNGFDVPVCHLSACGEFLLVAATAR